MHRSALLLALLLLLAGCGRALERPDPHTIAPTTTDKPIGGRTTLEMPMAIPGQPVVLVPFAIESDKDFFQTKDPYRAAGVVAASTLNYSTGLSSSAPAYYSSPTSEFRPVWSQSGGSVRWHNVILRDLASGDEWSILDRRGVINWWAWHGVQSKRDGPIQTHCMVFTATIADSNRDGVLNDLDARVAILTDSSGRKPRIVTPANAQVWNAVFDSDNNRFYLLVVAHTNKDGKYDYNDAPVPYSIESGGVTATPIVSDALLGRVEALLK